MAFSETHFVGALAALTLAGCGLVNISEAQRAEGAPESNYTHTARLFWLSNRSPTNYMLNRAASYCKLPQDQDREVIQHTHAYGMFGDWLMDFSCPTPEMDMQ